MKKLLVSLLLTMICATTFAAYQYTINSNGISIGENLNLVVQFTQNSFFKNYDTFGYTVTSSTGETRSETLNTSDVNGKKFDLGNFSAGDTIAFTVGKGNVVSTGFSIAEFNGNNQYYLSAWTTNGSINDTFQVKFTGTATGGGAASNGGSAPSGQPLPGILATLLVGGGVIGVMRKRRKAAQA